MFKCHSFEGVKLTSYFVMYLFQQIMSLGDQNLDGHMSFEEFVKYVTDHQKKLWIVFKSIDQDNSGNQYLYMLVNLGV